MLATVLPPCAGAMFGGSPAPGGVTESAAPGRHAPRLEARPARPRPAPNGQHGPCPDRPRHRPQDLQQRGRRNRHYDCIRETRLRYFATLAAFERALISERTVAGLSAARARGRTGGRPFKVTPAKLRLAMAARGCGKPRWVLSPCTELGVTRQSLYRRVSPSRKPRPDGAKLFCR